MKGRKPYRKKKSVWSMLLLLAALVIITEFPGTEADAATSASDFKMKGTTLVKYRGSGESVSVPKGVEVIGESAFEGNTDIETVVLPDSVKHIEPYAFWGCDNLETVVLGKGLKEVGDYAFTNCKGLERMTIPENVGSIGIQAFADCINMTDITIAPEVTAIHDTAFDGCYRLTIHCEPGSAADKYAQDFYEKQKEMPEYEDVPGYQPEKEDMPEKAPGSSEAQGDGEGEAVTDENEEKLLGSTRIVGNQAVVFMKSTAPVVLQGQLQEKQETESSDSLSRQDASVPSGDWPEPAKYTIVDGKIVADQAYYRNQTLGNTALPEGITEIGQFAFARSSITQAVIPDGVEKISYGAFYHCDALQEVSLPESISLVEPKAFEHSAWVENFLQNGDSDFLVSGGVLAAYRGESPVVEIPQGVRVIAGEVFLQHGEIQKVVFPDSLVSIGEGAFENCSGLTEVDFGADSAVTEIKDRAFAGCALTRAEIPGSVKKLGIGAFEEDVQTEYLGEIPPENVYEVSAQRLSNEDYRKYPDEDAEEEKAVVTVGTEGASAYLEGASRSYTLEIREESSSENPEGDQSALLTMKQAYERGVGAALPDNTVIYDLKFYDKSEIPLTKLGKQTLTVTIPVPEALSGKELQAYTTDRNGQLERVAVEKTDEDGTEYMRFSVSQIAPLGIAGLEKE